MMMIDSMRNDGRKVLISAATPMEAHAAAKGLGVSLASERQWHLHEVSNDFDMLITGVGKASAAGAVGRLCDLSRHRLSINVGVAGVLPGAPAGFGVRSAIWADRCVLADEGAMTPDGFVDLAAMGFPPTTGPRWRGVEYVVDPAVVEIGRRLGPMVITGGVATVSVCSGTCELADEIARRTVAMAEAMEGAAAALAADRVGVLAAELRTMSNLTGPRLSQAWDIKGALAALSEVLGRLRGAIPH